MFGRHRFASLVVISAALAAVSLAGCDNAASRFAELDSDKPEDKAHVGVLVPEELDGNNDELITPAELNNAPTYARSVDEFFADGDSADDKELTKDEFAKALLGKRMPAWQIGLIALAVVVIPIPIGVQIAKSLRMPDYGWQIALILVSITAGGAIAYFGWPPKLGIDLSGGIILIYEIDEEATKEQLGTDASGMANTASIDSDDLAAQLRRRINPGGVSEIVVRPYGPRQVEIIIPNVEEAEIDFYKRLIERTGQLEFFIVANDNDHEQLIEQARENVNSTSRILTNDEGETIGRWVPVGKTERTRESEPDYRGISLDDTLRARRGESNDFVIVDPAEVAPLLRGKEPHRKQALDELGYRDLQALVVVNPLARRNVKGQHVRSAQVGSDNVGRPAVHFQMTGPGSTLLGALTGRNQPDPNTGFHRRMAIIMDNEVMSAPQLNEPISGQGQITGDFTQQEVEELVGVLNAGRLPAVMRKDPISENQVSSLLGADTIRSGAIAIGLSLIAALAFMLVYYRFAGFVACLALLLNLLLILAIMTLIKATFTLPGIAGLVLTVGMSVDANVLIFERIREELARGAALRMAIRNGFQRATTTIVDANLTTLITATVLYVIGTDQIRGFAVTLWLGIVMSMYTAIFCSRVVFDIAERKRWIKKLSMMQIVGNTHIDFIGRRKIAAVASIILIVIGMGALVARGKNILDIDFLGGTSVQILFDEPKPISEIRERVESGPLGDVSVVGVPISEEQDGEEATVAANTGEYRSFIINSSITGEEPPEVGDPVKFTPSGQTVVQNFIVTAVNPEADPPTADLKSRDGKEYKNVDWDDIERDGVAVVQKRLIEIFSDELTFHSMKILDLKRVGPGRTQDEQPPATQPDGSDATSTEPEETQPQPSEPSGTTDEETPSTTTPDSGEQTPPADETEEADTPADDAATTPPTDDSFEIEETPDSDESSRFETQRSVFSLASYRDGTLLAQADSEGDSSELGTALEEQASEEEVEETTDETEIVRDGSSTAGRTRADLRFDHPMTATGVRELLKNAIDAEYGNLDLPPVRVSNPEWDGDSGQRFAEWTAEIPLSFDAAQRLLSNIEAEQADTPVWLSANKIGGQVAGNLQQQAIMALLVSLLLIIGYIWLRFQRVVFGLAAVVALVHDVLITLGAIAVSMWIAKATMGVLLIDEFKISLPIVAALLTVIGYSLNDTIVVFDRIREVRGKNPELTQDMINTSVNQTLGRTLLTSLTTLIVVVLLYFLGGQAIRGFAFALVVGVLVGTYSSIFVASPALLWMINAGKESKSPAGKSVPATTKA